MGEGEESSPILLLSSGLALTVAIAFQPVSKGEPHSFTDLFSYLFNYSFLQHILTIREAVVTTVKPKRILTSFNLNSNGGETDNKPNQQVNYIIY